MRTSVTSARNLAKSSHIAALVVTTIASHPSSEPSVHRVSVTQVRQTISRSSVDRRRAAADFSTDAWRIDRATQTSSGNSDIGNGWLPRLRYSNSRFITVHAACMGSISLESETCA